MTQTAAAEEFLDAVDADDDCGLDALRGRADRDRALTNEPALVPVGGRGRGLSQLVRCD
jgi:hypothetical protein